MFEALREQLIESYRPRRVDDAVCAICGTSALDVAMHLIEWYQDDRVKMPNGLIPMSQSRQTLRGSVPICTRCSPVCGTCGLPIATRWTNKVRLALASRYAHTTFVIGNGYCRHVNPLKDLTALFKTVPVLSIHTKN